MAPQLDSLLSHQSISSPFQFEFTLYPDLNAEPMKTVKEYILVIGIEITIIV